MLHFVQHDNEEGGEIPEGVRTLRSAALAPPGHTCHGLHV